MISVARNMLGAALRSRTPENSSTVTACSRGSTPTNRHGHSTSPRTLERRPLSATGFDTRAVTLPASVDKLAVTCPNRRDRSCPVSYSGGTCSLIQTSNPCPGDNSGRCVPIPSSCSRRETSRACPSSRYCCSE